MAFKQNLATGVCFLLVFVLGFSVGFFLCFSRGVPWVCSLFFLGCLLVLSCVCLLGFVRPCVGLAQAVFTDKP